MNTQATQIETRGSGWRAFAGVMILLVGIFNFIDGIVAVLDRNYYAYFYTTSGNASVTVHHLVFGDIRSWGWAILILGIIEVVTALAIFAHMSWAAAVGIVVAACNAIGQLLLLGLYPWWSIIAIAIDVLVIYGLAVYGFGSA